MKSMVQAGLYSHRPRLVLGDFNDIKGNDEKIGGPRRSEASFSLFREMLSVAGLHEVRTIGGHYTWTGQRHQHSIKTRIDRVFATSDWQDLFPKACVQMLKWIGSDHRPLLLNTSDRKWRGMKLFRYDNRWRMDPEVYKVVDQAWNKDCATLSAHHFSKALVKCRNALARWKSSINNNSQKKIQQLQQQLHNALEEEYWKAKSRIQWLQAGDKNTKFFHAKTKQRRNFNRLISIQDDEGNTHFKPEEVQKVVKTYFQNLFTSNQGFISPDILQVMEKMGFNLKWRIWIMKCLTSVTYSVLINGVPSVKIIPQRGIRQDDSLLFCKATEKECQVLLDTLKIYEKASGQEINYNKSAITFSKGSTPHIQKVITSLTGISKIGGFGKYLGLPESIGRNRNDAFSYITQRIHNKLENWYSQFLSPAGKEVLIKAVVTALPTYTMSCFMLPTMLIHKITSAIRKFWWSADKNRQKLAWISWEKLTASKREGGIGTRQWNQSKIHQLIDESDAVRIQRIRPSLTQVRDTISWTYTNNGEYNVKSGYYIQRKLSHVSSIQQSNPHVSRPDTIKMYQKIWRLQVPPKIKHFWWRVVHNSLPVADALIKRNLRISQLCQLCGDHVESLNHLLFQCKVAKEIWELAPLETPDASWVSPDMKAGIGWSLYRKNGQQIVQGSSSIDPTSLPIEAEALALLMAIQQVKRLGYHEVMFVGDSKILYQSVQSAAKANYVDYTGCPHEIATYVNDIIFMSKLPFIFEYVYIPRKLNSYVDKLAKLARVRLTDYIVTWNAL